MISRWYSSLKAFLFRLNLLPVSIGTILLIVNLLVLALPLGSILFFRLYENQLVRETEAELIAQSAFIAEIYKREVGNQLSSSGDFENFGAPLNDVAQEGVDDRYTPQETQLDLASDTLLPPRPAGVASGSADGAAQQAGEEILPLLNNVKRTTLTGMRLLDANGIVVSGGGEVGLSFAHIEEVSTAMDGRYASVIRQRISDEPLPELTSISRGTGIRIFTAYPIVVGDRVWGVVYLSRTPKSILKYMYDDRAKLGIAVTSVVLLTLLIALLTSWTIARPIHRLVERTQRITAGDRSALSSPERGGTKEMALLSDSFSNMATELDARSNYIKEFATHVSHELKTPLASIRGAAELLDDHTDSMSRSERQRFVHNIIADADRTKQLVSRLLQLARADNPEMTAGKTELTQFIDRLCSSRAHDGLKLDLEMEAEGPIWAPISDEALQMIMSNLLSNAHEHNATHVQVRLWKDGETVKVSVRDDGDGISPANREKIFEPFFTTRRDQGGTGLGLGIIRSLLQNHKGSIRLDTAADATCFVISIPVLEPQ